LDFNYHRLLGHRCSHSQTIYEQAFAAAGQRPFALPGDKPHYAPDRQYAVQHIALELKLDFPSKSLEGLARLTVQTINDGLTVLEFDAAEMEVKKVYLEGQDKLLTFRLEDEKLKINLSEPKSPSQAFTVVVEYQASPRRGLYFIAPDEGYPDKKVQVWSQGQDTDNHYWFPCYDAPNQKSTSEMTVTVPADFFALSNGALLEVKEGENSKTFHWKHDVPHASYLITLAAGPFVEIMNEWQDVPVPFYVLPGREEEAKLSLGKTPKMVDFFSKKIGVRYPYAQYATVCVGDFIFGGMENTGATTLTEYTLHDERAHQDFTSDPLVAHELAHQWFGDLLTCRDWSNGWLNEGFATYFEALWREFDMGRDEFIYEMYGNAQSYLSEDGGHYRRPIVAYTFNQPIDLFDRHLYEKGSLVLHMLRYLLGDEGWWKTINYYVTKHRGQNVITADLERAVEEATGRNLQAFFEQWVYKAGYPQFKLEYQWDDSTKTAKFKLAQTQKIDSENPLFTLPVELAFVNAAGTSEVYKVDLEEKEHTFYFRLAERPEFVSFDPSNWVLKTVEWSRPKEMLIAQLEKDKEAFGRIGAAQALGKLSGPDVITALEKALKNDTFWAVRNEVAQALGAIKSGPAQTVLMAALPTEKNARVRRAIAAALGEFRDEQAAETLEKMSNGDVTDIVEMAAINALGKTRQLNAFDTLSKALERSSFNEVVRSGAFQGFAELRDERAIPLLIEWSAYGKPEQARNSAIAALGRMGKLLKDRDKEQVTDRLLELLQDKSWRTRLSAIGALQTLGEDRALPALRRNAETALDGREIRRSREALINIRESKGREDEVKKLREDVEKLTGENRELRDRLESLEQRVTSRESKAVQE